MRSLLVVCLLALCLAAASALPLHSVDTALVEKDPVVGPAPVDAGVPPPAPPPAPTPSGTAPTTTGAVRNSRQCAAAGGDCLNTATGATCATGFRNNLCNGGATVKCCVTRPPNPALLNAPTKPAGKKPAGKAPTGKVPARVVRPSPPRKGKADKAKATPAPTPANTPAKTTAGTSTSTSTSTSTAGRAPPARKVVRSCALAKGKCASATSNTCSTPFQSGMCPGSADIKCCTGKLTPKAAAPSKGAPAPKKGAPAPKKRAGGDVTPGKRNGGVVPPPPPPAPTPSPPAPTPSPPAPTPSPPAPTPSPPAPTPSPPAPTPSPPPPPPADRCAAASGKCVDSDSNTCSTAFKSGLCPGRASIKCCTGVAAPKPVAPQPPAPTGPVSFAKLAQCYPQGTADEVKKRIGGAVNADWIANTCAIRMSHTINCAGRLIPNMGAESIRGKAPESWQYIFRVKQLSPQVKKMFGNGQTFTAPTGRGVDVSNVRGKKGIIYFDTTGEWDDATGHFDLWDGNAMVEANHSDAATTERYFRISKSVTIWTFQ